MGGQRGVSRHRLGRAGRLAAGATVLAAVWGVLPTSVGASVAGDSAAIVVSSGTLKSIRVASTPVGVQKQPTTFALGTQDYALRACAGKSLTFTLNGSALQVGLQSGSQITVSANVVASLSIIVSTPSWQYLFRCLPDDFPPVTVADHGSIAPGWYVTATITNFNGSGPAGRYDMILDSHGTPVWYKPTDGAVDFQQLSGSSLSWAPLSGPGIGTDPNATATVFADDTQTSVSLLPAATSHFSSPRPPMDPHELLRLSNGDYMMLTSPVTTGNSVTFTDATGTTHTNVNIVDCVIEEINSSGALVWSWDAYYDHHLAPSETFLGTTPISSPGSGYDGAFDVYHCNSLDVHPTVSNPSQADVLLSRLPPATLRRSTESSALAAPCAGSWATTMRRQAASSMRPGRPAMTTNPCSAPRG
jgi:hypothetical protein